MSAEPLIVQFLNVGDKFVNKHGVNVKVVSIEKKGSELRCLIKEERHGKKYICLFQITKEGIVLEGCSNFKPKQK